MDLKVYDEVYEPEEAEHSGMKTPVEEDHSQRGEEDEIEGAEAIGEEAVVVSYIYLVQAVSNGISGKKTSQLFELSKLFNSSIPSSSSNR